MARPGGGQKSIGGQNLYAPRVGCECPRPMANEGYCMKCGHVCDAARADAVERGRGLGSAA